MLTNIPVNSGDINQPAEVNNTHAVALQNCHELRKLSLQLSYLY